MLFLLIEGTLYLKQTPYCNITVDFLVYNVLNMLFYISGYYVGYVPLIKFDTELYSILWLIWTILWQIS